MELGTSNELIASFKLEINDWGDRRREFTPRIDPGTNNNTREALVTIWTRQHYFTDRDHVYENVFLDQSTAGKLRVVKEIVYLSDPDSLDRDRRRCSELETMAMVATNVRPDQKRYFVDFLGWYERKDRLCLVLEYCSFGNIDQCFPEPLPEKTVRAISEQVLEGLAVLHGLGITHRDIKPQNILVAQEDPMWVKIADFGISKHDNGQTDLRSQVGTEGYMAPEILLDETKRVSKYSNAVDMWSFGCLVYYLLTKKVPFPRYIGLKDYYEGFGLFPDEDLRRNKVGESGIIFIRCLMDSEPEKRPIASGQLVTQWTIDSQDTSVPRDGILPEEPQDPDSDSESGSRGPSPSLGTPQPPGRPPIDPTTDYWSSELLRITKTPRQPGAEDRIRVLLDSGARPNPVREGYTPLHHSCEASVPELVKLLLQYGADVQIRTHPHNETPLHLATYQGNAEAFVKILNLLVGSGVDLNAVDDTEITALHLLVARVGSSGAVRAIERLIALGADTEIRGTTRRMTPLQYAIALDREEKAMALIQGGANVNVRDESGRSILHDAIVSRKASAKLIGMLVERGADVNARDDQELSPLHEACRVGRPDIVHILIKHEADTNLGSASMEWRVQWLLFQRKLLLPWQNV
ncbi:kinase-like protein [Penicillium herquei]|nr:kinase-like protein [Penicillium herquei]